MNNFNLVFLTAEKKIYEGSCYSMDIPISDGQYGIMANHSNMIAAIIPGIVHFKIEDTTLFPSFPDGVIEMAIGAGVIKVTGKEVLLVSEFALFSNEIDEKKVRMEARKAHEIMLKRESMKEYKSAEAALSRAMAELRLKGRRK